MKKTPLTLLFLSVLSLWSCTGANTSPTGSQSPSPASNTNPALSANPAAGSSTGTATSSGKTSLEQMKAYSACLKAAGSNGVSLSSSLDITIAGAEALIKQGATVQGQAMLDQAFKTIDSLEATYNIDCLK